MQHAERAQAEKAMGMAAGYAAAKILHHGRCAEPAVPLHRRQKLPQQVILFEDGRVVHKPS
jgi:hypothetical protein